MSRVKVRLHPGWRVYVEGADVGPGEVAEVGDDLAAHLVERGVAEVVEDKPKARRK